MVMNWYVADGRGRKVATGDSALVEAPADTLYDSTIAAGTLPDIWVLYHQDSVSPV